MADSKEILDLTKLNGSNYSMWKFGVNFVLQSKDLTGFVNSTGKEPDRGRESKEWNSFIKKSSQAAVILLSSVENNLHQNLIDNSTLREIWTQLQALYGDSSVDAKQSVWEQFYAFRMSDGESMAIQVEKLESICKKLDDAGEKPTDAAVMTKLLSSLRNRFSVFRVAWDYTPEADRKKSRLIARLIKEEKRLSENEDNMNSLPF